jgi:methylmalonyl-CoA/ethylmalonyl-CoA epimerase
MKRCFSTSLKQSQSVPYNLGRLNHIAIATPNLEESAQFYRNLRAQVSEQKDLPDHGVSTIFVELPNTKLELLHPFGEKSPIQGFLDKNPMGGMHHICLEVDNLDGAIGQCKEMGIRVLGKPKIGAHGLPVIFLHPKDCGGVLVELEEVKQEDTL